MLEPDPLACLLVLPAVAALGFVPATGPGPGGAAAPAAVFVPLERTPDCRRTWREALRAVAGAPSAVPLLVGYGAGGGALLAAHRAHGCCDLVLRLTAGAGGEPAFAHLPAHDVVAAAGLSPREADVLVLLLDGHTSPSIAARLCVAESTVRSHCRAVLRKVGVRDRRALRSVAAAAPCSQAAGANFAEEWPVAPPSPAAHT